MDKLVQLLHHPDSEVQYEVAWILTNISSGASHQTRAVVEHQACIPLCHLLSSPVPKVKDQVRAETQDSSGELDLDCTSILWTGD